MLKKGGIMAGECIVKVPKYSVYDDYDFIGFSFNGYHCIEDLNIIRLWKT